MNKPFTPNIIRFRKSRRRFPKGIDCKDSLVFYNYGFISKTPGMLFSYHLEMMRKTIANYYKRQVKFIIRCFPNLSYTTKPHDVRRGRGKGSIEDWYCYIKTNKVILEVCAPNYISAKDIYKIVRSKLPIKIELISKAENKQTETKIKENKDE